jgi:hypothetical protein
MVDMADRADVAVRLGALEFCLAHRRCLQTKSGAAEPGLGLIAYQR